jgi:hypothetical protein
VARREHHPTGLASPGFLVVAVGCTLLMAQMMGGGNGRS